MATPANYIQSNPPNLGPIEQATARLESEISLLNDKLETFYHRLSPFLSQDPKKDPQCRPPSANIGTSPAVLKLMELGDRLVMMITTVDHVRERLEL